MVSSLLIALFGMASGLTNAEMQVQKNPLPLWETGVAAASFYIPDYPGAEQNQVRYLGLPYFIYRGPVVRAGEGGVRTRFIKDVSYELDLSGSGSFPADSEDNDARDGMPDLDWLFEIGPRGVIHAFKSPRHTLDVLLPVHAVFSTDFGRLDDRGFVFRPTLDYRWKQFVFSKLTLDIDLGAIFATQRLMDYFYEVSPRYATAERPAYEAEPGLLKYFYNFSFRHRISSQWFWFTGWQTSWFEGAKNRHSPLLKDKVTHAVAIGFIWRVYASDQPGSD